MTHAISMLMTIASILLAAGLYGVLVGSMHGCRFGPFKGRDAQLFGIAHVLVALYLVVGAATDNTQLKFGACMMVPKIKTCSWASAT